MSTLLSIIFWAFTALGAFFVFGTLLSLTRSQHWFIRGWDFPRVLIAGGLAAAAVTHAALGADEWYNGAFIAALLVATAWQLYKIAPYTFLVRPEVARAEHAAEHATIRLVASNVLMENDQHARWLEVVRAEDPDLILVAEMDDTWLEHLRVLEEDYPHTILHPQDNHYGMGIFSRFPLSDTKVRFIVEDEIPSIHTCVTLPGGGEVYFHGLHPRPPEPINRVNSTQRDAELVVMGREIREERHEERRPTIVAGDFNDVAWSRTTELFLRLSELLDPRKGRGLYNSFDANSRLMSYPVDHVFHSNEFTLVELKLLDYVGSDHYPVLAELCYEPGVESEQPTKNAEAEEEEEADEHIRDAEEEGFQVNEDPI